MTNTLQTLQIYFFWVKRHTKNDFPKHVEGIVAGQWIVDAHADQDGTIHMTFILSFSNT